MNTNGKKLIEMCKSLDLHIVNGRFGADTKIGNVTRKNARTVDYAIVSPELMPIFLANFEVDTLDKFLSDCHCYIFWNFIAILATIRK